LSLELKADLLMAIEDYEAMSREQRDGALDIIAVDNESDEKVLLRLITEPASKSGYVGVGTVESLAAAIADEDYDKGVLIGSRFTKAAESKMADEGIQGLSEDLMLDVPPEQLYLTARDLVDSLCKRKCGFQPQKASDCKGYLDDHYSCDIRFISDNASFHFERGWTSLLQKDSLRLLSMHQTATE
jgi:hypothetical protein